mgnify:CR=1 FL=1
MSKIILRIFENLRKWRQDDCRQFKLCFSLKWLQSLQSRQYLLAILAILAIFIVYWIGTVIIWQYFNKYWQYDNNTGNPAQLCVGCWWQDRRSIDLCQTYSGNPAMLFAYTVWQRQLPYCIYSGNEWHYAWPFFFSDRKNIDI